jgi:hypothetical protein
MPPFGEVPCPVDDPGDLLQQAFTLLLSERRHGSIRAQTRLKQNLIGPDGTKPREEGIVQEDVTQGAAPPSHGPAQVTAGTIRNREGVRPQLCQKIHIGALVQQPQSVTQLRSL